jgi:hypothetical protein
VTEKDATLGGPLSGVPVPDRWDALRRQLRGRPRQEHKALGYLEVPNGGNRCSARGERATATWENLFVMGPDLWSAAGDGRLQFLISPASLRAGRFDHVCGVFDST